MGDFAVRVTVLLGVLIVATAVGLVLRRRSGRAREVIGGAVLTAADLTAADLTTPASPLGERATLVQFSSPACSPCRAVHRILEGMVAQDPSLRHVDVDATTRLDLAARLGILRTPTVLILDPDGLVIRRMAGLLTAEQVSAAVPHSLRSTS